MPCKLLQNEKGFTLVEILVAMVILGLVFSSAFLIYERGIFYWYKGDQEIELQQSLRITLDRMSKDFRQANPETIQFVEFLDSGDYKVLLEEERSEDGKLEVKQGVILDDITYKRTETILRNTNPIAEKIEGVYVTYDKPNKLVNIRLVGKSDDMLKVLETEVYLRVD